MSKAKHGKNKAACKLYRLQGRREKNKLVKVARDERMKKRAAAKRTQRIQDGKPVHKPTQEESDKIFLRQQELLNNV